MDCIGILPHYAIEMEIFCLTNVKNYSLHLFMLMSMALHDIHFLGVRDLSFVFW